MSTIQDAIHSRLTADPSLTALLTGGIYKQPIKRLGPGSTPNAFSPAPPYAPIPAATVTDEGEAGDPLGPAAAFRGFPRVWFYAGAHQAGKDVIDDAWELAYGLLHGHRIALSQGTAARLEVVGRLGVRDDPALDGALVDNMRVQVIGLWRNLG